MFNFSKNLLSYIDNSEKDAFHLLENLAKIPAPSGKEELRAKFVSDLLVSWGATQTYIDDALNVVCPIGCDDKKDIIVFMAHTDVVFPDETELPFSKDEKYFYCPGITDDTACLVNLLMVVKYVLDNNLTSNYGILFVANSCEEGLGNLKGTRKIFENFGDKIKALYTFDGFYDALVNKCVGSHRYKISCTTEGGHSYGAFGNRNAIYALSNLICSLYDCKIPTNGNSKTTYNVGIIEGGTSINTIAQNASVLYEYRSDDKSCLDYMQNFFNTRIKEAEKLGLAEIKVEKLGDRPCGGNVNQADLDKMTNLVKSVSEKHSNMPCKINSGSTDCNIPMSLGIPAVCVGNCMGSGPHTREEKVEIKSIKIGLKITAEIVLTYFNV